MEHCRLQRLVASALVLALVSLWPGTRTQAQAATSRRYSLAELVQQSDATVLGHPVGAVSFWDHGRILTRVSLKVDEVWDGSLRPGNTVDVLTLGGEVGDIGQRIDGAAALPSYGRVVLHLRRGPHGYTPTAMAQGVWQIDAAYGRRAGVHQQAPAARPRPLTALRDAPPIPQDLAALRAAVEEAARARP